MTENPFDPIDIDVDQANRIDILRGEVKSLFASFTDYLKDSRYTTLALNALEEAYMWSSKSIAFETQSVVKKTMPEKES